MTNATLDVLAASTPTPLSAVVVARVVATNDPTVRAVLTRRRWIAGGLREDVHLHNTSPDPQTWVVRVRMSADFAHVFVRRDLSRGGANARRLSSLVLAAGLVVRVGLAPGAHHARPRPVPDRTELQIGRSDLDAIPDLSIDRLVCGGRTFTVEVADHRGHVRPGGFG